MYEVDGIGGVAQQDEPAWQDEAMLVLQQYGSIEEGGGSYSSGKADGDAMLERTFDDDSCDKNQSAEPEEQ